MSMGIDVAVDGSIIEEVSFLRTLFQKLMKTVADPKALSMALSSSGLAAWRSLRV
jgi:hypothetical protein